MLLESCTIVSYSPPPCTSSRYPRHEADGYRPAKQDLARQHGGNLDYMTVG